MSQASKEVDLLCEFHEYDFKMYKGSQPINKIARNLVDYEAGKTILQVALNCLENKTKQLTLI